MAFLTRYSNTLRGNITFTGNTLGFSPAPTYSTGIGAFLSTIPSLVVPNYPSPSTLVWQENGSTAVLSIPIGSIISYAELIWGGATIGTIYPSGTQVTIPTSSLNGSITFKTPLSTQSVFPDPSTASETPVLYGQVFYTRSLDVTALVQSAGNGTYAVGGVPGALNPCPASTGCCGWILAVVYENLSFPINNINLYVGISGVTLNDPPVDTTISNFATSYKGTINSRVLVGAFEGNTNISGDSLLIGPNATSLSYLTGPNNNSNNFFDSTINNDLGNYNTTGSFGNLNQIPGNPGTGVPGARAGLDITNVNASSAFINNQTSALVRIQTNGDAYAVSALGFLIAMASPNITVNKFLDKSFLTLNDTITYTLVIKNTGSINAEDLTIFDALPDGINFVSGSINSTEPFLGANIQNGITFIDSIPENSIVTLTFQGVVSSTLPSNTNVTNIATASYSFVSGPSIPVFYDTVSSTSASSSIVSGTLNISKYNDNSYVTLNDILTYTLVVSNIGNTSCSNIILGETLPSGTSLIPNSIYINNIPSLNTSLSNITLPNLSVNSVNTIVFKVKVYTVPNTNQLINTANLGYSYTLSPSNPNVTVNTLSNSVLSNFRYTNVMLNKQVNDVFSTSNSTLIYTITITNTGNVSANNLIFKDTISSNVSFVENSFTLNNTTIVGANPNVGISLGNIAPNEIITLRFSTIIN